MAYDEGTAERVRTLLKGRRDVAEMRMMGGLCFIVRHNMCVNVTGRGGLMVRVGPDGAYDAALAMPHVEPIEMRGRPMTGFVYVLPDGYRDDAALTGWVERALAFNATLPPGKAGAKKAAPKKTAPKKAKAKKS